jgi:hypothetical protein
MFCEFQLYQLFCLFSTRNSEVSHYLHFGDDIFSVVKFFCKNQKQKLGIPKIKICTELNSKFSF